MSLLGLVITLSYKIYAALQAPGGASIERISTRSFMNQASVVALEKLYNRVQEGIEILDPKPGVSASYLTFRDVLNHTVTIKLRSNGDNKPGTLLSYCETSASPETGGGCPSKGKSETGDATEEITFYPAPPIKIEDVKSITFTPLSALCVQIRMILTMGSVEVPLDVSMELKNSGLAYQN